MHRGGPQVIPRPPQARAGGPPPWAGRAHRLSLDDVIEALTRRGEGRLRGGGWRPEATTRRSAVLVPLYEHHDEPFVVLTRRSPHLRSHRHEVSFPGGRIDDTDDGAWGAALREAEEEIALRPDLVAPVGALDAFVTVGSQSLVQPLVGRIDRRPDDLSPNPDEVEHILHVSLWELLDAEVFREELWPIGGHWRAITFFELVGDTVWGATGAMLRQLLAIATGVDDDTFLG